MTSPIFRVSAFLLGSAAIANSQQEILHYKFNEACGNKVVNYAVGSPAAPDGRVWLSP